MNSLPRLAEKLRQILFVSNTSIDGQSILTERLC